MAGPAAPPPGDAGTRLGTAVLGLLAETRPAGASPSPRVPGAFESAAPLLEAALIGAAWEPALLPHLSAALERLGRVPVDRRWTGGTIRRRGRRAPEGAVGGRLRP